MKRALSPIFALGLVAMIGVFSFLAMHAARATDTDSRYFDRQKLEVNVGTAAITTTLADFTTWQPLVTVTPNTTHALNDVKVVIDLAKATTGFAATYTSQTIQFAIARRVDGTNWRTATNTITTAVSGTNSTALCIELNCGSVGPNEAVRIEVKLSAEGNSNTSFPFIVNYFGGALATVTPAS